MIHLSKVCTKTLVFVTKHVKTDECSCMPLGVSESCFALQNLTGLSPCTVGWGSEVDLTTPITIFTPQVPKSRVSTKIPYESKIVK